MGRQSIAVAAVLLLGIGASTLEAARRAQIELDRIVSRAGGQIITQSDIRRARDLHLVDDVSTDQAVQRALALIIAPFQNANLNHLEPFSTDLNPTAENVARHIARQLALALRGRLPRDAKIAAVAVTEAPGCVATYRPRTPEGPGT